MAVRKPGFDNSAGNRNRRVNRYGSAGANNDTDIRHKEVEAATIAFAATNQITDSGNGLAGFEVGEYFEVLGSVAQDGTYEVSAVVAGAITTVEATITLEALGPTIILKSLNNRNVNRAA